MTTLTVLPLLQTLRDHADDPDLYELHDLSVPERQWTELVSNDDIQIWLISWPPGASTGWHDHGVASGAVTTIRGQLVERSWQGDVTERVLESGHAWAFSGGHIHDVRNELDEPALSVHAYSPRLATMTTYDLVDALLEVTGVEQRAGEHA